MKKLTLRIQVVGSLLVGLLAASATMAQGTRLLRQPALSRDLVAFAYGADLWLVDRQGGLARRLTSTAAVESHPSFSPDGKRLAFSSNRSGVSAVYVVPIEGGTPERLTWYPSPAAVRGWTPDGSRILYTSSRETAPRGYDRLWTVAAAGGPSTLLPAPWGHDAAFSPDADRLLIDRVTRSDSEWRNYRGGQNTALTLLDLSDLSEVRLPNERSTDVEPVWTGGRIYFLSDRDAAVNVWTYDPQSTEVRQLTHFADADVKSLDGHDGALVLEQNGYLHILDPASGELRQLDITVHGDFPWAERRWEDVSERATSASLSPTGKRALFEARGDIFTVPTEKGDARNLTRTSGAADRRPLWSPDGGEVAWFSDGGSGYELLIAAQEGLSEPRHLGLGESKMVWDPTWSPDGTHIAFVDDDVRIRVIELESGQIRTVDEGGTNLDRGSTGLVWSPDSQWLAYAKTHANNLRRVNVWSRAANSVSPLSDPIADARSPAWDRDGRHLYLLASTDLAQASGWANTSSRQAEPRYGVYVVVLRAGEDTPFVLESDEEEVDEDEEADLTGEATAAGDGEEEEAAEAEAADESAEVEVQIDLQDIDRRVIALPMPVARYVSTVAGPEGTVFVTERSAEGPALTVHKFSLESREAEVFVGGVTQVAASQDGKKLLLRQGRRWRVVGSGAKPNGDDGGLDVTLRMNLDRGAEWQQIFDEAWRYERDFFYDPGAHGNDWDAVRRRYAPLIPHVRHRADLSYVLDQVGGELSVGHSFVFGGDVPEVDEPSVGLLGADLVAHQGRWRIERIYTFESWNPNLAAPLDQPGLRVEEGQYLLAIDGVELTAAQDPYRALDGTAGRQTVLQLNDRPAMDGSWRVTVEPVSSENALRQRAWVEDNRRRVDELSAGRLAYVWVPNTGGAGVVSFDRYFFAQQDKLGAVIDERFNGGGLLDDYMVDLMTRSLRAAITNEVPNGRPMRLPAGILGPKVLLINELAGSGGDFFPWVFRQQGAGPLIGTRTWGGLVKSSVHYPLVDGGALTAPDNAVFDPASGRWIAENEGVAPDIEVFQDAAAVAAGRDPQLERAVQELLRRLPAEAEEITPPPFPRPSRRPAN